VTPNGLETFTHGEVGISENYKTLQLSAPVASQFRMSDIIFVNSFE